ncbi:hypothetical protein [Rhodohalobacter sp.]|uniref:hypothetical protein n=1 Tax=Rhodohalobacter sp. TaxID=1974210 RepID=UPI003567C669
MTEKERKAIETLQARIEAINAENFDPIVWTDQTCIHIQRIFGAEKNERIKQLRDISYSIPTPMVGSDIQSRRRKKGKQQAKEYLLGYIEEIKNYGLESEGDEDLVKVKKSSFQTLGKNISFWGLILVLAGGAFTLGMHFGKSNFDKEKMDYYQRNLKLETEIDSLQNKINAQDDTIKKLNAENKTLNE